MRNILFSMVIIAAIIFSMCRSNKEQRNSFNTEIFAKAFIPVVIRWKFIDTTITNPQDSIAKFQTFYFLNDSFVYMFNCISHKDIHCKDISIYDRKENIYNDTVSCHYEDSIRFGVENVEMYMGTYEIENDKILFEIKMVTNARKFVSHRIQDTLKIIQQGNNPSLLYKNQQYKESVNFDTESYRRLLEFTNL